MRSRLALAVTLVALAACTNDFDMFDFGGTASTGTGGAPGTTSTATTTVAVTTATATGSTSSGGGGGGGFGGAAGGGGAGGCDATEKLCAGNCVAIDDPAFGCAVAGCAPCSIPNATASCSGGSCVFAACTGAFADCDGLAPNGCEIDTATDVTSCGACGRACAAAGTASVSCTAGLCDSTCDLGFGNCALPAAPLADDGCEADVLADDESCGGCGNSCSLQGGASNDIECDRGAAPQKFCGCSSDQECRLAGASGDCLAQGLCECDGATCQPSEACMRVGAADICACNAGPACAAGQSCCQTPAGCRDLSSDAGSCGACGHACPPGFSCSGSVCQCSADAQCDAGSAGAVSCGPGGLCVCEGVTCAVGERCQPAGTCG